MLNGLNPTTRGASGTCLPGKTRNIAILILILILILTLILPRQRVAQETFEKKRLLREYSYFFKVTRQMRHPDSDWALFS